MLGLKKILFPDMDLSRRTSRNESFQERTMLGDSLANCNSIVPNYGKRRGKRRRQTIAKTSNIASSPNQCSVLMNLDPNMAVRSSEDNKGRSKRSTNKGSNHKLKPKRDTTPSYSLGSLGGEAIIQPKIPEIEKKNSGPLKTRQVSSDLVNRKCHHKKIEKRTSLPSSRINKVKKKSPPSSSKRKVKKAAKTYRRSKRTRELVTNSIFSRESYGGLGVFLGLKERHPQQMQQQKTQQTNVEKQQQMSQQNKQRNTKQKQQKRQKQNKMKEQHHPEVTLQNALQQQNASESFDSSSKSELTCQSPSGIKRLVSPSSLSSYCSTKPKIGQPSSIGRTTTEKRPNQLEGDSSQDSSDFKREEVQNGARTDAAIKITSHDNCNAKDDVKESSALTLKENAGGDDVDPVITIKDSKATDVDESGLKDMHVPESSQETQNQSKAFHKIGATCCLVGLFPPPSTGDRYKLYKQLRGKEKKELTKSDISDPNQKTASSEVMKPKNRAKRRVTPSKGETISILVKKSSKISENDKMVEDTALQSRRGDADTKSRKSVERIELPSILMRATKSGGLKRIGSKSGNNSKQNKTNESTCAVISMGERGKEEDTNQILVKNPSHDLETSDKAGKVIQLEGLVGQKQDDDSQSTQSVGQIENVLNPKPSTRMKWKDMLGTESANAETDSICCNPSKSETAADQVQHSSQVPKSRILAINLDHAFSSCGNENEKAMTTHRFVETSSEKDLAAKEYGRSGSRVMNLECASDVKMKHSLSCEAGHTSIAKVHNSLFVQNCQEILTEITADEDILGTAFMDPLQFQKENDQERDNVSRQKASMANVEASSYSTFTIRSESCGIQRRDIGTLVVDLESTFNTCSTDPQPLVVDSPLSLDARTTQHLARRRRSLVMDEEYIPSSLVVEGHQPKITISSHGTPQNSKKNDVKDHKKLVEKKQTKSTVRRSRRKSAPPDRLCTSSVRRSRRLSTVSDPLCASTVRRSRRKSAPPDRFGTDLTNASAATSVILPHCTPRKFKLDDVNDQKKSDDKRQSTSTIRRSRRKSAPPDRLGTNPSNKRAASQSRTKRNKNEEKDKESLNGNVKEDKQVQSRGKKRRLSNASQRQGCQKKARNSLSGSDSKKKKNRRKSVRLSLDGQTHTKEKVQKKRGRRRSLTDVSDGKISDNETYNDSSSTDWTEDEVKKLKNAHKVTNAKSSLFWDDVADRVEGRSSSECREKWFSLIKTPIPRAKQQRSARKTASVTDAVEDDLFNSTPMRQLFGMDGDDQVCFDVSGAIGNLDHFEFGSAIKVDTAVSSKSSTKKGYKTYLKGMKRDVNRNVRERRRSSKKVKKPPSSIRSVSKKSLSEKLNDGDFEMKCRLSPGGTLEVQHLSQEDDDLFFYDDDVE